MNLPPDIKIPDGVSVVTPRLRRAKLIGRLWVEARCLFNRSIRISELAAFEEYWHQEECESLARRLVYREFMDRYGPASALRAATLRYLPRSVEGRAEAYQLNAKFQRSLNEYRRKLGLTINDSKGSPKPP